MGRLEFIEDWIGLAREARYSSDALASLCAISGSQLRRFFIQHGGRPPQEWLSELRLWHAMERLCAGASVKEVAAELNFGGVSHFCRQFKRYHGCTPTECVWIFRHRQKRANAVSIESILPWKEAEHRLSGQIRAVRNVPGPPTEKACEGPNRELVFELQSVMRVAGNNARHRQ